VPLCGYILLSFLILLCIFYILFLIFDFNAIRDTLHASRDTSDEIRDTNWAIRAGILDQIPKKIKKFSPFLTLYFTTTYLIIYPLSAICYPLFFVPNAQVRPFIEGTLFPP